MQCLAVDFTGGFFSQGGSTDCPWWRDTFKELFLFSTCNLQLQSYESLSFVDLPCTCSCSEISMLHSIDLYGQKSLSINFLPQPNITARLPNGAFKNFFLKARFLATARNQVSTRSVPSTNVPLVRDLYSIAFFMSETTIVQRVARAVTCRTYKCPACKSSFIAFKFTATGNFYMYL